MARRSISLDEKIEKAEAAMLAAKAKYDKALDEMEKLVMKRKQLDEKKFLMPTIQVTRPRKKLSNLFCRIGRKTIEC